jgi:Tfp pilus assembly protein PilW
MVSMTLSLLAVSTMVILMANTLRTGSNTIQMSRLSQELRAAMQLMSRDLRRANYHSSFLQCFANADCRTDLGISAYVNTISVDAAGDCFWYWLDRNGDADLSNDAIGAFRLGSVNGTGVIQMRTAGNGAADCESDDGWEAITDFRIVDITGFTVAEDDSYTESLSASGDQQFVEKIRFNIAGRMLRNPDVTREIQDLVLVRNDIQTAGA